MRFTRSIFLLLLAGSAAVAQNSFDGRWDLTIKTPTETYPSWMEVKGDSVRVVGRVASVHPVEDVKREGTTLIFHSSESFGKSIPVDWSFQMKSGKLTGTQKRSDGVTGSIVGEAAPKLDRPMPTHWSQPKPIFNGKDLSGWLPDEPAKNHWQVENGELVNAAAGANLRTTGTFSDFKLHIEYNCPQDGNSGVYLRGRYETQVEYEPADKNDDLHGMGAIYGFLAPAVKLPPKPGQWESYDITLVGRTVTVIRDGTTTIDGKEIPGITGGALDSHEGLPGRIYIQGDHTGGMKYRNITVSVPSR